MRCALPTIRHDGAFVSGIAGGDPPAGATGAVDLADATVPAFSWLPKLCGRNIIR
jgi:hypothetical protein